VFAGAATRILEVEAFPDAPLTLFITCKSCGGKAEAARRQSCVGYHDPDQGKVFPLRGGS